ncbi:succinate dehydrogenase / fumarate reductase cytochrome b subunit [Symbiobacterium terraclitae]|uniref:Succinate dehydrogenase / fumarate reductase cytochrome b subunit n=1 Tax=Symbiobacterium terraclitae TaxID=557451 RepID=A0ABS4JR01_9FIRM|nr:succinate dehydrogenase, cytochrome b556 subunit [Symbiobacterium terraclitae]MBP2017962.1 succinate dehydrogenase / fumarate reductase cytochrome b subunit [Symbiobacterium terraclitae]
MERAGSGSGRAVRSFADLNPRYFKVGMWSHALHRISGVAIVFFLLMHIWEITSVVRGGAEGFTQKMAGMAGRIWVIGEWLLFLALVFHGINGVRLVLLDLGWGIHTQKRNFWVVMVLSAILIAIGSYFFVMRFLAYPWVA